MTIILMEGLCKGKCEEIERGGENESGKEREGRVLVETTVQYWRE